MAEASGKQPAITSVLEWISAGIGLLLAAAIAGVIGWQALQGSEKAPPALHVSVSKVARTQATYVVEIDIRNASNSTAAGVIVRGELKQGGTAVETSETTIAYVPARSKRSGGLMFSKDPRGYELSVRPVGYEQP